MTWRAGSILGEPDAGSIREGGHADFFLVTAIHSRTTSALWRVWRVGWIDA